MRVSQNHRQTDSGYQLHLCSFMRVSLPPTPDLLNPNLKDTVICAMKITPRPPRARQLVSNVGWSPCSS